MVEPVAEEPAIGLPVIDTECGRWIHGINRMAAEAEAGGDSFLGGGFVQGPSMAIAIDKPRVSASTSIDAGGRIEHMSEYRGVDESGAVCFPLIRHRRRAGTVIKIAGEVMLRHGYVGRSRVVMNIACARKSRIMTAKGYCFYRMLESVDSKACLGFNTQHAWVFTGRELRDGGEDIAGSRADAFLTLYREQGEWVREDGTPV